MARKSKDENATTSKSKKELLQEKVDAAKAELDTAAKPYNDLKNEIEKLQKDLEQKTADFKPIEKAYLKAKANHEKVENKLNELKTRELVEQLASSGKSVDDLILMLQNQ
jgi:DNA repair exonuclease SbcCD ATPase subunit